MDRDSEEDHVDSSKKWEVCGILDEEVLDGHKYYLVDWASTTLPRSDLTVELVRDWNAHRASQKDPLRRISEFGNQKVFREGGSWKGMIIGEKAINDMDHYTVAWAPTLEPDTHLAHMEDLLREWKQKVRGRRRRFSSASQYAKAVNGGGAGVRKGRRQSRRKRSYE